MMDLLQSVQPSDETCADWRDAQKGTNQSWLCTRGSCEVSWTSIIMLIRRSRWKKDAAFFPDSTFRIMGTYFWRSWAAEVSVSHPPRIKRPALATGSGPPPSESPLITV